MFLQKMMRLLLVLVILVCLMNLSAYFYISRQPNITQKDFIYETWNNEKTESTALEPLVEDADEDILQVTTPLIETGSD